MTALAISNVVLWIVVLVLLVVVFALTRQIGLLHERIAPAGALMINRGLTVGEAAPVVEVVDLNGQPLSVGAERSDGLSTLILFLSPTCPVCESLLPALNNRLQYFQRGCRTEVVERKDGSLARIARQLANLNCN